MSDHRQQLFSRRCERCFDTGLWLTFAGDIAPCPESHWWAYHPTGNAASEMLKRCSSRLRDKPNALAFDLARVLTHFTSSSPCPTYRLLDYFFGDTQLEHTVRLRKLAQMIEELRRVWTLPVGSRKDAPYGYWIITDLDDCKAWLRAATAAPRTQLVNIWRSAKAAFPVLAGQQEFAFMETIQTEDLGDVG